MGTTLLSFVIVLGVIVFVHELGHFLAAKLMGARVEVFSIGFPPKMVGFQRGETEYRVGWIPLGGYVKIAGMVDESLESDAITGAPDEFTSKSFPAKVFIITAGVLMNFLLGFLIFSSLTFFEGRREADPSPTVGSLSQEFPAAAAGIKVGDRILSIEDEPINSWDDLMKAVHPRPNDTLLVRWQREDQIFESSIVTRGEEVSDSGKTVTYGFLGIGPNILVTKVNAFQAIADGAKTTYRFIDLSLESIGKLITRKESLKAVAGPVGIMQFSGESARAGLGAFLGFIGFISVSIGLLNIMPLPVLDGGHLVYIIIETIIRRPIPIKVKLVVQQVGIALLLLLFIVVTYNDITRVFSK